MYSLFYYLLLLFVIFSVQSAPLNTDEYKNQLIIYGFLKNGTTTEKDFTNALKLFQKSYSLPITGKLDTKTIQQMDRPRCGKFQKMSEPSGVKYEELRRNPWGKSVLTYKFNSYPRNGLQRNTAIREIGRAFNLWAKYIPVRFESRTRGRVDIDIHFIPKHEGDGIGRTLAYAYFPRVGNMYFDAEPWTAYSHRGTNLFNTAAHEIGHSLGLEHSNNGRALMNPYIFPYNPNLGLFADDINRIQRLYGRKLSQVKSCELSQIDAAFYSEEDEAAYLIKDNNSWKIKDGQVQAGYPKEITKEWTGIPDAVDAAYYYNNNIYFVEGTSIWKHDKNVKKEHSLVKKVDAAVAKDDNLYLFAGSEIWQFNMSKNGKQTLQSGYPKQISSVFTDAPSNIDAIFYDPKYYFYYLFKDSSVYKFNTNKKLVEIMSLEKWVPC